MKLITMATALGMESCVLCDDHAGLVADPRSLDALAAGYASQRSGSPCTIGVSDWDGGTCAMCVMSDAAARLGLWPAAAGDEGYEPADDPDWN